MAAAKFMVTKLADPPLGGEGPAILQLHQWRPSHLKLNLRDFREAFISPTRRQLLLLSGQDEALLLPLLTGEFCNPV